MSGEPKVLLYYGDALQRYSFGKGHPFGPDRLSAFWKEACRRGLDRRAEIREPAEAAREDIERFHDPSYLDRLREYSALGAGLLDMGDTPAFPGIYEAAATVVGTTLAACESLIDGEGRAAFVPIAGLHHARRGEASGFCALNDIGVAIEMLKQRHGLDRIVYVDIDVHHGDGVFYSFEDDPTVIFADIHEDGRFIYPGTGMATERGQGSAVGKKLNIPMLPYAGDQEFLAAWEQVEAFVDEARPQFILMQCGADGLEGDMLGDLRYSTMPHAHAASALLRIADRHCPGRLLGMGGGGYNRDNLAAAWCAVVESFVGD